MLKKLLNRQAYRRAASKLKEGEVLCATLAPDGKPIYFPMPADSTDVDVRNEAFVRRNGRPMNRVEELFLNLAEARRES